MGVELVLSELLALSSLAGDESTSAAAAVDE